DLLQALDDRRGRALAGRDLARDRAQDLVLLQVPFEREDVEAPLAEVDADRLGHGTCASASLVTTAAATPGRAGRGVPRPTGRTPGGGAPARPSRGSSRGARGRS